MASKQLTPAQLERYKDFEATAALLGWDCLRLTADVGWRICCGPAHEPFYRIAHESWSFDKAVDKAEARMMEHVTGRGEG